MAVSMSSPGSAAPRREPIDLDRLTMADVRAGALEGRHVTVLGLARSGISLARFLLGAGAVVTGYDGRPLETFSPAVAALAGEGLTVVAGPAGGPAGTLRGADLGPASASDHARFPATEPPPRGGPPP